MREALTAFGTAQVEVQNTSLKSAAASVYSSSIRSCPRVAAYIFSKLRQQPAGISRLNTSQYVPLAAASARHESLLDAAAICCNERCIVARTARRRSGILPAKN